MPLDGKRHWQNQIEPIRGLGRCWLSVFRFVGGSKIGLKQMRYLDYVRSSAIARLLRKLKIKNGKVGNESADDAKAFLYFGKPFSYYGSCERLKGKFIAEDKEFSLCDVAEDAEPTAAKDVRLDSKEPKDDDVCDEEFETSGWERARGFGG